MRKLYNQLAPAEHANYPDAKRTIHTSMSWAPGGRQNWYCMI